MLFRSAKTVLKGIDEEKRDATLSDGGKNVVIAGPGSGKTTLIVHKIAYLIMNGVAPEEILLLTFTRSAAMEMMKRIEKFVGKSAKKINGGTFHSFCNSLLKDYRELLSTNLSAGKDMYPKPFYRISDTSEIISSLNMIPEYEEFLREENNIMDTITDYQTQQEQLNKDYIYFLEEILLNFSEMDNKGFINTINILTDKLSSLDTRKAFDIILYEYFKISNNLVDFTDLQRIIYMVLKDDPEFQREVASRFKWIIVDEFQDTSPIQLKIVEYLSSYHKNLFCVGDDAQSIYGFRGANFDFIRKHFIGYDPSTRSAKKVKLYKLTKNFRSTPEIAKLANASLPPNCMERKLVSMRDNGTKPRLVIIRKFYNQSEYLYKRIKEYLAEGEIPSEICVLFRANWEIKEFEKYLMEKDVPYQVLEKRKPERQQLISLFRVILRLALQAETIIEESIIKQILRSDSNEVERTLKSFFESSPGKISKKFYKKYSDYFAEDKETRKDINRILKFLRQFSDIQEALEYLNYDEVFKKFYDKDSIILSTVHQAKGHEWNTVFVAGVSDERFPSKKSVAEGNCEEEQRLFYVAITRAKKNLEIIAKYRYYISQKKLDNHSKCNLLLNIGLDNVEIFGISQEEKNDYGQQHINRYSDKRREKF